MSVLGNWDNYGKMDESRSHVSSGTLLFSNAATLSCRLPAVRTSAHSSGIRTLSRMVYRGREEEHFR
jgi:hypothetical protein